MDTFIASFLETGSVSWLYYSDRLAEFPLGILGVALATAMLPKLARDHVVEDEDSFSKSLGSQVYLAIRLARLDRFGAHGRADFVDII